MILIDSKWYIAPIELNGLILTPIIVVLAIIPLIKQLFRKQIHLKRELIWIIFLIYVWLLVDVTLFPIALFGQGSEIYKLGFGKQLFINLKLDVLKNYLPLQLIGNVLLFAPLSLFGAIYNSKFAKWHNNFLLVFSGSLIIEVTQLIMNYFYLGNRVFDINDLVLNSFGGLLGLLIFKLFRKIKNLATTRC
ncbi:glycopeptide antibiotics resistance protein [Lactobacillus colini]|uniref:Glycopeptide antibiotics resistance protein n=1 Tax=Lactobacillus colini TaxID=1819254 RepID=A0ABS4MCE9_9LACO|nr:VanZ family protein [Lactobacillus colini]MBP2057360.1 glycopeptide antibiotics resistance protein [Lactobacillus colini]